jgi:hypothetical protein
MGEFFLPYSAHRLGNNMPNAIDRRSWLTIVVSALVLSVGAMAVLWLGKRQEAEISSALRTLDWVVSLSALLMAVSAAFLYRYLRRLADETEAENHFPPKSDPELSLLPECRDEAAWLAAGTLRAWAGLILAIAMSVFAAALLAWL